ncbi:MAG: hypothetical protein JXR44_02645 [Thiotrichales bacterium]|nr:hypothetical protein [Thiotrichales bacterium]
MKQTFKLTLLSTSLVLGLSGCGGGGGDIAGISGTGFTSTGTISGFGSVLVGGVKYDTNSTQFEIDGRVASEQDLRVGMVVQVEGEINADRKTGKASRITFDDDLQGPITGLTVDANDPDIKRFTIYGTQVVVSRTRTKYDDDLSFVTLADNQIVEISGYYDANNQLVATYVDDKDDRDDDLNDFKFKGVISNLNSSLQTFSLNGQTIRYSAQTDIDDDLGSLQNGQTVEVEGRIENGNFIAEEIDDENDAKALFVGRVDNDDFDIEGYITNFNSANKTFNLRGVNVDASGVNLTSGFITLGDNVWVEVEGFYDRTNNRLIATEIELRSSEIDLKGAVQSVALDANGNGSFVMSVAGNNVTIFTGFETSFDDDDDRVNQRRLNVGEQVEVEGYQTADGIFALEIDRNDDDDNDRDDNNQGNGSELKGIYEGATDQVIRVSGLNFTTSSSTRFENDEGFGPRTLQELLAYNTANQPKLLLEIEHDASGNVLSIEVEDTDDNDDDNDD